MNRRRSLRCSAHHSGLIGGSAAASAAAAGGAAGAGGGGGAGGAGGGLLWEAASTHGLTVGMVLAVPDAWLGLAGPAREWAAVAVG